MHYFPILSLKRNSLFLFFFLSDGHHLWETEAKVDRDASKSVSDACDAVIVTNLVSFQDYSTEDEAAVLNLKL